MAAVVRALQVMRYHIRHSHFIKMLTTRYEPRAHGKPVEHIQERSGTSTTPCRSLSAPGILPYHIERRGDLFAL